MSLLQDLLAISLTAVNLLRPLYDPAGELIDFAPEYFNPAAQRMTGLLTERPAGTARTLFPDIFTNGIFDFYRQVFDSGEAGQLAVNYQADRLDNYFRVAAQRSGELLIVSFTDTADQDRSAVEQALRESQAAEQAARAEAETQRQRFYDLLMQLPAQVAVHEGADQVFTLVNPGYQRLAPGRALQGQPIREAWPELVSQGILDVLDHVYQTGEPFIGKELPFQVDFTRTGQLEQVYFNAFFLPLRDAQGQLRGVLDYSYDVTEQVLARQQLQQFNAELEARVQERTQLAEQAQATAERERTLLQIILAQSPVAIGVFQGEELRITAANAQMAALWGRTPEQVLNRPFMEGVPELRGQGFDDLMRQVLHTEVPFIGTETPADVLRGEQVQTHYYNFVYQPLYDADGQVLGVIDVAVEVTEQVLARQQVEMAAAESRLLTAHTPAFLFRTDAAGSLVFLNKEFFAWTGLDATQLRSLDEGWATVHPGDLAEQQPSFVAAVQAGQPWQSTPYRFRRADGQYRWMLSRSQPLLGTEGQVLGHSGLTLEVHEQVELQQQLARTNVELDTFVYTASHDLKAPITNIESITLALRDVLPAAVQQDEMIAHLLDLLEQTTARFQVTISQLTDLSKLQLAHAGPAEPVNLAAVIESVRLDLAPLILAADAQLTVVVAPDLLVSFSPGNLRSAVYNLLSNAVKYRALDRPAQVQVRAFPAGGRVTLEVHDNGLGLNEHQQSRLFGLFQRLHTHVEGTGVGLYTTKRLVENGGGTIAVESQVNVGTTFTLTFPA